jgi:hypothetical protein
MDKFNGTLVSVIGDLRNAKGAFKHPVWWNMRHAMLFDASENIRKKNKYAILAHAHYL